MQRKIPQRRPVNPLRICEDCGGPTSDRRARRCRACVVRSGRPSREAVGEGKVLRVHPETWRRIQQWAVPLEDTPDSTLRKILDAAEKYDDYRRKSDEGG